MKDMQNAETIADSSAELTLSPNKIGSETFSSTATQQTGELRAQTEPTPVTAENSGGQNTPQPKTKSKLNRFIQILKFTGFSISAGVIQLVSDGILCDWTGWLPWWPAYLISVVLSVIWNFTFNRKFTFKAANNVPLAMCLVIVYYCAFIPLSVFGGNAIAEQLPENLGLSVTFMMMLINFVTEFVWDKFVVFNQKVTDRILNLFKKK